MSSMDMKCTLSTNLAFEIWQRVVAKFWKLILNSFSPPAHEGTYGQ